MILEDPTYFELQNLSAVDRKLYRAVYEQGVQEIVAALDGGANLECKLQARHHNYTPLVLAVDLGDMEAIQALLDAGADVNASALDDEPWTPVIQACYKDNLEALKLLVERGADIEKRDYNGDSALDWALSEASESCAQFLVGACSPDFSDSKNPPPPSLTNTWGGNPSRRLQEHCWLVRHGIPGRVYLSSPRG